MPRSPFVTAPVRGPIGVIVNANARGPRIDPRLGGRLRATLGNRGELRETRSAEELEAAIDHFVRLDCDLIATCGGDGTNLSTLTQVVSRLGHERLPRLAILPAGTVNTVAKNLRVGGRPEEILGRLVRRMDAGEPLPEIEQDAIEVNGRCGFLFAAAMGARFLEAYYAGPVQDVLWATLLATRIVGSCLVQGSYARWLFASVPVELEVDGEPIGSHPARLVLASVVPDVGIGMKVTWQAGKVPRRFHLVVSALSTTSMALQLHKVRAGRPLDGRPHLDRLARDVVMRFREPSVYTLDGELFHEERVHVRMGPRVRIVKP
jgi:diacylglycerol kinase family enzyme